MTNEIPPFDNVFSEELRQFVLNRPGHNPVITQAIQYMVDGMKHIEDFHRVQIALKEGIIALTLASARLDAFTDPQTQDGPQTLRPDQTQEATPEVLHAYPQGEPHREGQTSQETESALRLSGV